MPFFYLHLLTSLRIIQKANHFNDNLHTYWMILFETTYNCLILRMYAYLTLTYFKKILGMIRLPDLLFLNFYV